MAITLGPKLGLLYDANQGEEYTQPFREFLSGMDTLIQASIITAGFSAPPASPADGDAYIVSATATGAWTGQEKNIAVWSTQQPTPGWQFFTPKAGWLVWDITGQGARQFFGGVWSDPAEIPISQTINGGGSSPTALTLESVSLAGTEVALNAKSSGGQEWRALSIGTTVHFGAGEGQFAFYETVSGDQPLVLRGGSSQAGISLNGSQTLTRTTGNGQVICTHDATTFATNGILMSDASSNIVDSGILASDVAQTDLANTFTQPQTFDQGFTTFDPVLLVAATPASGSANFDGPALSLQSNFWNGSASAVDQWIIQPLLGGGTNPSSTLSIVHSGSSGTASVNLPTPVSIGSLSLSAATTTTSATSGAITPPSQVQGFLILNINGTNFKLPFYNN
jgi:hypothetical protein